MIYGSLRQSPTWTGRSRVSIPRALSGHAAWPTSLPQTPHLSVEAAHVLWCCGGVPGEKKEKNEKREKIFADVTTSKPGGER